MEEQLRYNQAVQAAYTQIIRQAKQLLSSLEEEPLRAILERQDEPISTGGYIVHELINPLIYARLEVYKDDILGMHYGYEQSDLFTKYYPITSAFIRSVDYYTAKENTPINIENSVRTDWVVTNCAELYEYIGDRKKNHTYRILKYRKLAFKNKPVLKVA